MDKRCGRFNAIIAALKAICKKQLVITHVILAFLFLCFILLIVPLSLATFNALWLIVELVMVIGFLLFLWCCLQGMFK